MNEETLQAIREYLQEQDTPATALLRRVVIETERADDEIEALSRFWKHRDAAEAQTKQIVENATRALRERAETAEREYHNVHSSLSDVCQELDARLKDIAELESAVVQLRMRAELAEERIESQSRIYKEEIQSLRRDLHNAGEHIDVQTKVIFERAAEVDALERKIEDLEEKLAEAEFKRDDKHARAVTAEDELAQAERTISDLERECAVLRAQMADLTRQMNEDAIARGSLVTVTTHGDRASAGAVDAIQIDTQETYQCFQCDTVWLDAMSLQMHRAIEHSNDNLA